MTFLLNTEMRKLPSIGTVIFQTSEQTALFVLLYSDFYMLYISTDIFILLEQD